MAIVLFWAGVLSALALLCVPAQLPRKVLSAKKAIPPSLFAASAFIADAPPFLTMTLVLAALGDFAISRAGRMAVLYGLCSFVLMHLLFILLFQYLGAGAIWVGFALHPVFAIFLLIAALSCEMWLTPFAGSLRWPMRAYIALITIMGLFALGLSKEFEAVSCGAMLVVLSELVFLRGGASRGSGGSQSIWAIRLRWVLFILGLSAILWGVAGF